MIKITRQILAIAILCFSTASYGGLITVDYTGSYNEADAPGGDYDSIGGLVDVGLFNLVEGANVFTGSVNRDSDGFSIGLGFGLRLIGATINWATNLPNISFQDGVFAVPTGYLEQAGIGADAPSWTLEESSPTPEIFTISPLQGSVANNPIIGPSVISGALFSAPVLAVEEGIYSNLLIANGSCASTWAIRQFLENIGCVAALDYTITYNVMRFATAPQPPPPGGGPVTDVPAPGTIWLLGLGLLMVRRLAKK